MLMNNGFSKWLIAVVLLAFVSGTAWGQARIATVDLRKVFDNYHKTKQADSALKDLEAELKKELAALRESHKKLTEDYQRLLSEANDPVVSTEERERRKRTAESKLRDIKDSEDTIKGYVTNADERLALQRRRMIDKIIEEIRGLINARAKAGNYALVVDTSAQSPNGSPVFLYHSGDQDLTTSVLDELNATAPVELPKPAARPEDSRPGKR